MLRQRGRLFPAALLGLLGLTLVEWRWHDDSWLGTAVSAEVFLLLIWLALPWLCVYWRFILVFLAGLGPGAAIMDHLSGFISFLISLAWYFWLISAPKTPWCYWFVPYWVVVLAMAVFLVIDDLNLPVPA